MLDMIHLPEPRLLFAHDQAVEDPRDGITLFGPLDAGRPYGIRVGVIGTSDGIALFRRWVERIQRPIANQPPDIARPPFPGFEAAFRVPWNPSPLMEITIPLDELDLSTHLDDRYQRVFQTVDAFASRITNAVRDDDRVVDCWIVVVPDVVYQYCRPLSVVEPALRIAADDKLDPRYAKKLQTQPSLFPEHNAAALPYAYDVNFHHQLKARLLGLRAPTQLIREQTLSVSDPQRTALQPDIAWHLSTAAFYKAGGRPWKLADVRAGVCYLGIVFKRDDRGGDPRSACCAAQMFLDSGDGVVFKGALGPWYKPGTGDFHLTEEAGRELVEMAIRSYSELRGEAPKELFIHGRVRFSDNEWRGFRSAAGSETVVTGIRIQKERDLRLFRLGKFPPLRGLAYIRDPRTGFLWTRGYTPRLRTYAGRSVPYPLLVDICRGDAEMETVLADVLALTKLNYNACRFADGLPVTLRFADAVGEVLTAGPLDQQAPLPFRYYI